MMRQYLLIIWGWMSTVFVKMLVVWCAVTLLSILWIRLKKIHVQDIHFASPKREGILSLFVMVGILALLFVLQLLQVPTDASFLVRGLLLTGTLLLVCFPVVVILRMRHQGLETVGISRENLPTLLALSVVIVFVTIIIFAAISILGENTTLSPAEKVTPQRLLYLITSFMISALAHEFIYRGYLQTRLVAWGGSVKGLLASSLIYAVWHLPKFIQVEYNWITMLVQFMALFAFGLALGIIYRRTGNIMPSVLFHASNDLAQTLWSMA
ncbi:MAG: CPBP family intramembrane metalloprotease [Anaerolineae bacterium]|nr:CPBP family intramembrane metalloprotease [Anaerolineae bacterium]